MEPGVGDGDPAAGGGGSQPDVVVEVNVLFFAKAKELVGVGGSAKLELSNSAWGYRDLVEQLERGFPPLKELDRCFALALNEEYLDKACNIVLKAGDDLAVIPALSGG